MSTPVNATLQRQLLRGTLICAVLLIAGYMVFVGTGWGHELDGGAFFGRKALSHKVEMLDRRILSHVSKKALLLAAAILLTISAVRRCARVGVIVVAGFACAVAGAEVLKDVLPWRVLVPDDTLLADSFQADTYPSGHATMGTCFALGLLLVSSSRWRPWLAVAAGGFSAAFATGVLFAGWHRPSDSLGALAWSGLCMTVSAAVAVRLRGQPKPPIERASRALLASAGLAALIAAATWALAASAAPGYPNADLPFLTLTGLIITCAFALTAWYGWQLRAVDWVP